MSKVVFFNLPAHGHVNPTLAVVKELVARGETVIYYTGEEFSQKIEGAGAEFRPYPNLRMSDFDPAQIGGGNPFCLAAILIEVSLTIIPAILDELKSIQPDYILYDSMVLPGKLIARIAKIPAISSSSIFVFGGQSRSGISRDFLLLLLKGLPCILRFRRAAARLHERYGIARPRLLDSFSSREALSIVYTIRELQPGGNLLGDDYKFVGPSITARDEPSDFPFDRLTDKPVIYVSMGTLRNERLDLYQACFKAFRDSDRQVVLSVGSRIDLAQLTGVPDNFIMRNYVPQLEILPRAGVFITHGGMNSVHEGLYYRVPLLVIPQTPEQAVVGDQIVRLGAGLQLRGDIAPQALRAATDRLLTDPTFRQNSQKLSDSLKAAGGYKRAVDEIFVYKAQMGIH